MQTNAIDVQEPENADITPVRADELIGGISEPLEERDRTMEPTESRVWDTAVLRRTDPPGSSWDR